MTGFVEQRLDQEASPSDYIELLKPRVMSLVVFSGLAGLLLAPGALNPVLAAIAILCIAMSAGGAAAINMWFDRDIDAIMLRTQKRPIPQGRVTPEAALEIGVMLVMASSALMGLATNWVAAFWLLFAAMFYVFVYTIWLKRRTPQNIVIGGAAGAFPPVIGWAAVTGGADWQAWVLFAIIFLWTPPHFWALALERNDDYRRANVPMLPVTHGVKQTRRDILLYTLALAPLSLAPGFIGLGGFAYLAGAGVLGALFMLGAWRVYANLSPKAPMQLFGYSIFYLFALLSLLVIDHMMLAQ